MFACGKTLTTGLTGALLMVFGALLLLFWADLLNHFVNREKSFAPDSKAFKVWKNPPSMDWEFYLFNWTNAEEYLKNASTRPRFVEVGPYAYKETLEMVDVRFNHQNSTVSFGKHVLFHEDPNRTTASLQEPVTSINMVALTAANLARFWGYAPQRAISFALHSFHQEIFVRKTANELLFAGYREPLVARAKDILQLINEEVPYENDFGWWKAFNDTKKFFGFFNMETGAIIGSQYGMVKSWNYMKRSDYSDGDCGKFQGFSGELFPTRIRKDQTLTIFTHDMCRTVMFEFEKEETVEGVQGFRFVGSKRTVDNGTFYPENQCNYGGEFMPSGMMNATECKKGTPVYVSFPHFYLADRFYGEQIEGMMPRREQHQFFFTIEPISGVVLKASIRMQLNVLLQPYSGVSLYQDAPRSYVPVMWFSRNFQLPEELLGDLRKLRLVSKVGYVIGILLFGAGIAILIITKLMSGNHGRNLIKTPMEEMVPMNSSL